MEKGFKKKKREVSPIGLESLTKGSARHEEGEGRFVGMHSENLFDQDEDGAGERRNLATGRPFDNSTETGLETLSIRETKDDFEDLLGRVDDGTDDDEAARWLAENS